MSDSAPLPRTSTGHALHSLLASVARLAGELAALVVESVRRRVGPDKVPGPVLLVGPERRSGGWAARESEAVAMVLKEEQAAGQRLLQMPGHELVARYVGRLLVPPPTPMTSDLASGCAGRSMGRIWSMGGMTATTTLQVHFRTIDGLQIRFRCTWGHGPVVTVNSAAGCR